MMKLFGFDLSSYFKKQPKTRRDGWRSFAAAKIGNTTNDWAYLQITQNEDIKSNLTTLRTRSRELSKNNTIYRRWLAMDERNVIGPRGFVYRPTATDLDTEQLDQTANAILTREWAEWTDGGNCEASSDMTFNEFLSLVRRTYLIDGECFIRLIDNYRGELTTQIIDGDLCDHKYNDPGRNIYQGVELDKWGKPTAYYFDSVRNKYSYYANDGKNRIRIEAADMLHFYRREFVGQLRGFPSACASMLRLNMMEGYSEAELVAARATACKFAAYESPDGGSAAELADDTDDAEQFIEDMSPGKLMVVPRGYKLNMLDPKHPNGNHAEFIRAQGREAAAGLDVAANELMNDLENVNYSSMRSGKLSENDRWRIEQQRTIDHVVRPIHRRWLRTLLTTGKTQLPLAKFAKFASADWRPRRFPWVDPKKDAEEKILMLQNGLTSEQNIVDEAGSDSYEEICREREQARILRQKYNIEDMENEN